MAVDDPNNYLDGNWHHYAVTVSSANGSKVYVDGTLAAAAATRGGEAINPDTNIYLGARPTLDAIYRYDGALDDVRIYSKELDANEVAELAGGSANAAPTVDAGTNADVELPTDTTSLDATVTDDGLPEGQTVSQTWSKDSGPGTVTFTNSGAVDTTATFSAAGTYVLKLTAEDTEKTANDTVTITVHPVNTAPTVNAGADDSITLPTDTYALDAMVTDDGLPLGGSLTQTWSKDSGPGTVTFTNSGAVDTTATFGTEGTYVLKLSATDGSLTTTDTVQITVNEQTNTAPTVSAGADDSIAMPTDTVSLDGTVNDDGLPNPPAALTYTWAKDSGPGTVTFTSSSAVDTTATFSTIGTYVLRLTASDSALSDYDTVQITVNEESAGDPNLELHLKLDDGSGTVVADDSGHDRDGVTDATWVTGHISGGLEFDGAATEAYVTDFAIGTDFSVAFWFKSDDNSGSYYQYMFCWGGNGSINCVKTMFGEDSNGTYGGQLLTDICDKNDMYDWSSLAVDDPNSYLDDNWHHYAVTVSAANGSKVYVDGTLEATASTRGGDDINPETNIYLGCRPTTEAIYRYDGAVDDVRIYSKELDANEVSDLASQ